MIRILARKAFRFTHPGFNALSKPKGPETSEDMQRRIISDQQRMFHTAQKKEISNMYFDTKPNEIQDAPDWIKDDELFGWAVGDGDLVELKSKSETITSGSLAETAAALGEETVSGNINTGSTPPAVRPSDLADNTDGNMANDSNPNLPGGPTIRRRIMGGKKGPQQ